jgi:type II secretory pathway component GspD/PulD (secretin)
VIKEIAEQAQALPLPDPTPPSAALSSAPDKTPIAAPQTSQPVRGADVDFPTPADASSDGPMVMIGRPAPFANYGTAGNRGAAQLRSMPPETFTFDRAPLRDVLRLLADQAGIPYIGIPDHVPNAQRLVTFKITSSPFSALESLARAHDVTMTFNDGVWVMGMRGMDRQRIENENELIGVIYHLKHDPLDVVTFRSASSGRSSSDGQNNNNQSGSGEDLAAAEVPLQADQSVFRVGMPVIVNQIRAMLGLGPLGGGGEGGVSGGPGDDQIQVVGGGSGSKDTTPSYLGTSDSEAKGGVILDGATLSGPDVKQQGSRSEPIAEGGGAGLNQPPSPFPVYIPPQKPQVIYNSDTSILWVVATRKQHKWVAEYLQTVDKPQDLIAIEVKFFETNKNPQTDFGISWEGVFGGDGLRFVGSGSVGNGGSQPDSTTSINSAGLGGQSGASLNSTTISSSTSGGSSQTQATLGGFTFAGQPYSAVLSMKEATLAVQAFARDREGSFVQYPRVLTINNREVAISSAENTPINVGSTAVGGDGTATQNVGSVQYLPTGTQINILPKSIGENQIAMTVAITISAIVGEKLLDVGTGANTYPVTTSRVYNASLQVDTGYTLAVGGLEKTSDTRSTGGVPVLKDIPGLGYLFKNKNRNRERSNLIIFITPYLIDDPSRTPGISENPESTLPVRPGLKPPAPNFSPDGWLIGGNNAVDAALRWAEYQLRYFQQINKEARDDAKTINDLRGVIERVRALSNYLQAQMLDAAGYAPSELLDNSARADALLFDLNKVLAAAQLDQFQLKEGFP